MKLFFIRLGKFLNILKQDGFWNGVKRIGSFASRLFQGVGSGDILFLTGGVGDSALYRAWHQAEELEYHGFKCSVALQDRPFLLNSVDQFKIFVFHRTLFTPQLEKLINKIKAQRKEIIFETDDLVFDSRYLGKMDYLKNINPLEKPLYAKGVGAELLQDPYVKVCTTTTAFLADKLREFGKQVFIVPNKLSRKDVARAEKLIQSPVPKVGKSVKLGYFSGTISHNQDFALITETLARILEKYSQTELFLVGPLKLESQLLKFPARIKKLPYVPREKHFTNVASVDINLAPLEIGNPFCEAKSELKFFEAGIVGVPTVASATRTFQEAISDGFDGFTAKDPTEWENKLSRLILEPELRREMGQKALQKAQETYTTQAGKNEAYYAYLRSLLKPNQEAHNQEEKEEEGKDNQV